MERANNHLSPKEMIADSLIRRSITRLSSAQRWTKGAVLATGALGIGLLAACGQELAPPLFQLSNRETVAGTLYPELSEQDTAMIIRTARVVELYVNSDRITETFTNTLLANGGRTPSEQVTLENNKKIGGEFTTSIDLFKNGTDKKEQSPLIRSEITRNEYGEPLTERYWLQYEDDNHFVAQVPEEIKPVLDYDKNGEIVKYVDEEEALTGHLSTTTFEDLASVASRILKIDTEFPKGNKTSSSYNDRYVDDIYTKNIPQEDSSVLRVIIFSNKRILIEITWPTHKTVGPTAPRLSPGNQIFSPGVSA